MSKSVITMTKTVQRLQEQLAIAWDRVTKAERETIEKDEQLADAKQWKDISIHQGLKIKALEADIAEKDKEIERLKHRLESVPKECLICPDVKNLKKENAKLRELLLEVWNDWKNSPNVNDPEADGYELLQKIKKAVKHE